MKIKNTTLKNNVDEVVHPQTSMDQVLDKETGLYLDMILNDIELKTTLAYNTAKNNKVYTRLEEIGVTPGSETIEDIATNLPANSTLRLNKTDGDLNSAIYPPGSGILTVTKLNNASRISFQFERQERFWVGFYADTLGLGSKWSGWTNLNSYHIVEPQGYARTGSSSLTKFSDVLETGIYYFNNSAMTNITDAPIKVGCYLHVYKMVSGDVIQEVVLNIGGTLPMKYYRVVGAGGETTQWAKEVAMWVGGTAPNNNVDGRAGHLYFNYITSELYFKTNDSGNTGWKKILTE